MSNQFQKELLNWIKTASELPQESLDLPWQWSAYDEGVRFAFFRLMEELRSLTVSVEGQYVLSTVQRMLIPFHQAYWDLRAVLLPVDTETLDRTPGENDWSLRDTLYHVIETEWAFTGAIQYAFQEDENSKELDRAIPGSFWNRHFEKDGDFRESVFNSDLETMLDFYHNLHQRTLSRLALLRDDDLDKPVRFWEPEALPLQFRLLRYEAHLRQHIIQVEKTLQQLERSVNEVLQLVRLVLQAFGQLDAQLAFLDASVVQGLKSDWHQRIRPYMEVISEAGGEPGGSEEESGGE